jgi:hypothetical protein
MRTYGFGGGRQDPGDGAAASADLDDAYWDTRAEHRYKPAVAVTHRTRGRSGSEHGVRRACRNVLEVARRRDLDDLADADPPDPQTWAVGEHLNCVG